MIASATSEAMSPYSMAVTPRSDVTESQPATVVDIRRIIVSKVCRERGGACFDAPALGRRWLHLAADVAEQRVQVHAEQGGADDDRERDQRGDEPVLEGGDPALRFDREPARHFLGHLMHCAFSWCWVSANKVSRLSIFEPTASGFDRRQNS